MSTLVWVAVGILFLFLCLVGAIAWWAKSRVGIQKKVETREQFLHLASLAASDPSGRRLVDLLGALDHAPADCPVTVQWVRRYAFKDQPDGVLLKISWDGNEWRRIYELTAFRSQMQTLIDENPAKSNPRVLKMLSDLSETPQA